MQDNSISSHPPKAEEWGQERVTFICPRLALSDLGEKAIDLQPSLPKLRRTKMLLELPWWGLAFGGLRTSSRLLKRGIMIV